VPLTDTAGPKTKFEAYETTRVAPLGTVIVAHAPDTVDCTVTVAVPLMDGHASNVAAPTNVAAALLMLSVDVDTIDVIEPNETLPELIAIPLLPLVDNAPLKVVVPPVGDIVTVPPLTDKGVAIVAMLEAENVND
jgi:hypothetical protein